MPLPTSTVLRFTFHLKKNKLKKLKNSNPLENNSLECASFGGSDPKWILRLLGFPPFFTATHVFPSFLVYGIYPLGMKNSPDTLSHQYLLPIDL